MYDKSLLKDAIDIHIHVGPEAFKTRKFSEYELAQDILENGAYGAVIKTHSFETASRAALVNQQVPGVHFMGGLVMSYEVGGLNAQAVRAVASLGGKVIWLPTLDSVHERKANGKGGGIVCTQDGHAVEALDQVLKAIADTGLVMATGHIAWQEQIIAVKRAKELGVEKIIVNHPALFRTSMPVDAQKTLLEYDGVYLERNYGGTRLPESKVFEKHFEKNLADILATGVERSIMATDLGQPSNPGWSDGFAEYIAYMRAHGIRDDQIKTMICTNPRKLLGLT